MQSDLRAFVDLLDRDGRLLRLTRAVHAHTELAALILQAQQRHQAVLFENVVDSSMPVVANVVGDRAMLGLALGVRPEQAVTTFLARSRQRIPPVMVADSPAQEVVHLNEDVDLGRLPLVVHSEKDAGPYVTAGLVIAKDPQTGVRNVSYNRMMLRGPAESGIRMMPPQQLGQIYDLAASQGRALEVAVAIGNHPAELIAGATTLARGDDELAFAGALRNEPLQLTKCKTVDLEVPANAEVILEGHVLANVTAPEGPFGDFMQFYVPVMENRILHITAITHRHDAIYQTMHAGAAEDTTLLAISREAQLYEAVAAMGTDVREVSLVPSILAGVISIHKRSEGDPQLVMAAAFGRYRWLKWCVVGDEDVNVLDIEDVWWAIAARSRLGTGVLQLTDTAGFTRDAFGIHSTKLGIDATIPLDTWKEHERKRAPGQGRLRLEDYM